MATFAFPQLDAEPKLQAKTLSEWLQRKYPGQLQNGQRRTFQRGIRYWRTTRGLGHGNRILERGVSKGLLIGVE